MEKVAEIVSVQHLKLSLEQHHQTLSAIDDLSFVINKGEVVALLGESGCGKSITSLALMRLLPLEARYGKMSQVIFDGQDLLTIPEKMMCAVRGKRIAMIFQEPMTALNPVLTIGTQIAEVLVKNKDFSRAKLRQTMIELLEEVEISEAHHRIDQYPHQLSGGQRQRIVIAMALAGKPEVLIADEPTTALDVTTQSQILLLLKRLQTRYQMSILLITHDMEVVKMMASEVCVMYAGQLVESSPVDSFMRQPKHPYAQQLFISLPSFAKRDMRLQAIPGGVPALGDMPNGCRFHTRCAHAFDKCKTVEPKLQQTADGRIVRCHLYPELSSLPALPSIKEKWRVTKELQHDPILSIKNLSIYFDLKKAIWVRRSQPFKAVADVSFSLYQGKTLALVGESGCGKSTVCRALLRLQPITQGEVIYRGSNIETLRRRQLREFRKNVQIIFQDPFSSMNPRMTVEDILAEGMLAQKLNKKKISIKLNQLLDQVNLPKSCLTRFPHQFSGGQRQRICIARALATEPEIIICDEPTSALDISVQAQILNLMKELQYELGLSYLFVTHNMAVVSYIAHDVLVMRDGEVVETGTTEDILNNPKTEYTKMLLSCLDLNAVVER